MPTCDESITMKIEKESVLIPLLAVMVFTAASFAAIGDAAAQSGAANRDASRLRVLFLGNDGAGQSHDPVARINEIIPYLSQRGILITYTDDQTDIDPDRLAQFDVFMQYGNRGFRRPGSG